MARHPLYLFPMGLVPGPTAPLRAAPVREALRVVKRVTSWLAGRAVKQWGTMGVNAQQQKGPKP
jgi:hypothetical protein